MLRHLKVSNFALIEHLDLNWMEGFTTITGETGAGKSIMLGALNHLLGQRADLKALKDTNKKCVIEGTFHLEPSRYADLFANLELDFDKETIIRREILPSGKSRAFVNDSPTRLESLSNLTKHLIDIHSQHDTLLLNDSNYQLELIDSFGNHQMELREFQESYLAWKEIQKALDELEEVNVREGGDLDYLEFLLQELIDAKLVPGEFEEIESKLETLEHSGKIESALNVIEELSNSQPQGLGDMLRQLQLELKSVANLNKDLTAFSERAQSLFIEYEDLRQEMASYASEGQFDPQEKERLDQRISELIHLQRKHKLDQANDLIKMRDELDSKIQDAADRDIKIQHLREELKTHEQIVTQKAQILTDRRLEVKPKLEKSLYKLFSDLNLSAAQFEIRFRILDQASEKGKDQIEFMFSANPGQAKMPLQKVASGGELSRVMLSLKALLAKSKNLPTIIFDEIDTGVSGETALKIGRILKDMGNYMQVISITHLAQIASKGQQHYLVEKFTKGDSTQSRIVPLDENNRLHEVARLLGGDNPSDAAIANARELIGS